MSRPGGMSDETIPEFDPPPRRGGPWHRTAEEYCYDNGHTGNSTCVTCGVNLTPVRACDACGQSYVVSHLGDTGICRLCEVRETGIRNMIADEIRMIMDEYQDAVLNKIRQSLTIRNNPQP